MRQVKRTSKTKPRDPIATRAALIEAAAEIFRRKGYFATDSNAIAHAAGYAPGSFYKHFPSKAAILLAVHERYAAQEWDGVSAAAAGKPANRIKAILEMIEKLHGDWAQFRTDLRTVARIEPGVAAALSTARARQLSTLAGLTGRTARRHGGALLMILTVMERYSDALAEAANLGIPPAEIRKAMERVLTALAAE